MRTQCKFSAGLWLAAVASLAFPILTSAQAPQIAPRITQAIDETKLTTLHGNTHPLARPQYDQGAAPSSMPLRRMLLVLQRSSQQESALETLLEQQLDASSPNFHQWLTPQQFGQQFGPADQDIQTITSWLQSHGFEVAGVSNGRTVIEFSGTVGQVQEAFHTTIHQYSINGKSQWANSTDPQIPTALTSVVAGINTLYNFPRQPFHELHGTLTRSKDTGMLQPAEPLFTFGGNCGVPGLACYGVSPYDFATIYNVSPLWNASPTHIDGTGVTIAIVGESDISIDDVRDFRQIFGLPANDPNFIVSGPDPGTVSGDETESTLDVEWTGAVAKGATIDFVISQSTETSLGVDLSAQYIVDNNLAPVLSESYGVCELFLGNAGNQFFNQLWQQAAAQGISALLATGDSGSAVCDRNAGTQGAAKYGLSVSGFSSTPYNIAVGGTDFNDLTNVSTYWSSTNSVPPGAPAGTPPSVSALSYIPETTWNNSCTNAVFGNLLGFSANPETNCNNPTLEADGFVVAAGGSGGKSNCISGDGQNPLNCTQGYAKPAWQTALTPNDGVRDVPDISLFAAIGGPSGAFYLFCEADLIQSGATSCDESDPNTEYLSIGGTSASTPAFAGIMALVNQAKGSRQGNAANILYKLAGQAGASCNSTNGTGANCIFQDVTNGTIAMPCVSGSPNCTVSNPSDSIGVLSGYATTPGYDLATGLGSVNANNLVTNWKNFALTASNTTLTLNSGNAVNITHGQSVPVNIGVSGTGGTPTGNVSLVANEGMNGATGATDGVQGFVLNSGAASGNTNALPGGTYTVVAQYAGDGTFASSTSSPPVSVTVAPENSKVQIAYELTNPSTGAVTNSNATSAVFGTPSILRVNVTSQAGDACPTNAPGNTGCPTGSVALTDSYNGAPAAPLDAGSFALNALGYTEDPAIDLAGGTHNIAAAYNGDNSYAAPNPNPTAESITITQVSTQTSMTENPFSTTVGTPVTLDATLNVPNTIYSNHAPTGTVSFMLGTSQVGTATVSGSVDPSTHQATASASTTTTSLPHGQDGIVAQYNGDASYLASSSPPTYVSVLYPTTTAVTPSSAIVPYGSPVTFTAEVTTSQNGGPPITGSVLFSAYPGGELNSAPLSANGQATLTTSSLQGGSDSITATYSGDSNYISTSNTITETVQPLATTTVLTSSNSSISQGQSVTFTASVATSPAGGPTPFGGVVFFSTNGGNTEIGSVALSNGQAVLMTTSLPVGQDQITANFAGSTNFASSTSAPLTVTVTGPPSFSISANPTTINISAPGGSGSTVFTFTGQNGFSSGGSVMISANVIGLPSESSCGFASGTSVTIPANGSATATLNCTTTAPSSVAPASRNRPGVFGPRTTAWTLAFACIVALVLIALGQQKGRLRWAGLAGFAVFLTVASASCGGGNGGGGGGGGGGNQGTPPNNYPLTVSVTINGVTENVNIMLDVQ